MNPTKKRITMEIKIRFTTYFRKQITSVLMCCSRLLSLSLFCCTSSNAPLKKEALLAVQSGAARRPVKTAGLLD